LAFLSVDAQSVRVTKSFDFDWEFHKGEIAIKRAVKAGQQGGLTDINVKVVNDEIAKIAYTDKNKVADYSPKDWEKIQIPHDWLVEETPVHDDGIGSQPAGNGYRPGGIGFYRKEFNISKKDLGKKITIEFDGIFRNSTVWVNGHLMGNHKSGYIPSNYDLTDVLRYGDEGENIILVRVDATDYEGWWYEGAGIYRHVWLIKTDKLHVDRLGTFITTPTITEENAEVHIQTTIKNEYDKQKSFSIVTKIINKKGEVIDNQVMDKSISALDAVEVNQVGNIKSPKLWSPESPNLYKILTEVHSNNIVLDTYETVFGVRSVELTKDGFFLNGKLYPIKGTANHQDFAGVGVALPDKINRYRIKLLKEMGSNGYRTAHHPPTPELLEICDRLGMLVLDENRMLSSTREGIEELETLIKRDRNHPSVFMWSLENEESLEGTKMGARILKTVNDVAHTLDTTRPTTAAMNHGWNQANYSDMVDVMGYNYGQRDMQYVKDKKKYPNRKVFATESTSFVATRGEYEDNEEKGYMSNFGKGVSWGLQPGQDWKHVIDYPYLGGTFVWTGFDYRGEPTPYRWPSVSSHFGIMDLCGFPKDGYYAYKAAWTDEPLVHVYPHWNLRGKEGDTIRMGIYTNCDAVELFVNGESLGKKNAEPYFRLEWQAVYKPGKLEVKGYKNGKMVASEVHETTDAPASLTIESDVNSLKADARDVAIINIAVRDAEGRVVPYADNLVQFSINGPGKIIGTGNGDPSSHAPEKSNYRSVFNGYCQVLVQTTKKSGKIELKATSKALKSAKVILDSK
jgi:beta-galactosidase